MPETPFVAATFNMRRRSIAEALSGQVWSKRAPVCAAFLQKVRDASDARYRRGEALAPLGILAVQEAEPAQVDVAEKALGPNWTRVAYGLNIDLLVNTSLFEIVHDSVVRLDMKSGARQRHAVFARLESRATGDVGLFGVTHLAAKTLTEPRPETYRPQQMRAIAGKLAQLRTGYGAPLETVLFGDFNDPELYAGVRKIARANGLLPIEDRLTADQIKGEGYECHHGYKVSDRPKDPPTDAHPAGEITWICDALTKSVKLTRALLYRTDRTVYPKGACPSDHNLIEIEGTY